MSDLPSREPIIAAIRAYAHEAEASVIRDAWFDDENDEFFYWGWATEDAVRTSQEIAPNAEDYRRAGEYVASVIDQPDKPYPEAIAERVIAIAHRWETWISDDDDSS
jgi:hypothetical protein